MDFYYLLVSRNVNSLNYCHHHPYLQPVLNLVIYFHHQINQKSLINQKSFMNQKSLINLKIICIYFQHPIKSPSNFWDEDHFFQHNFHCLSLKNFQFREVEEFGKLFSILLTYFLCFVIIGSFGMAWLLQSLRSRSLFSSLLIFLL